MLDHRLPIFPRLDSPHDICVKETILELWLTAQRARRRDDLDHTRPSYPYSIGARITAENCAKWKIDELYEQIGGP